MNMFFEKTYALLIERFEDVRGTIPSWLTSTSWESAWPMLDYKNPDVQLFLDQLIGEFSSTDPYDRAKLTLASLDPALKLKNRDGWPSVFGSFHNRLESALRECQRAKYLRDTNHFEALKSLLEAVCHLEAARGMCIAFTKIERGEVSDWVMLQGAIRGGVAKAALNIPVKEQAVKLLYENVPPNGGWKNRTKAAEAIAAELWEFIEQQNKIEKRITLDPDNLVITLKQWASKDKDDQLLEAFNKTVRTKKKK